MWGGASLRPSAGEGGEGIVANVFGERQFGEKQRFVPRFDGWKEGAQGHFPPSAKTHDRRTVRLIQRESKSGEGQRCGRVGRCNTIDSSHEVRSGDGGRLCEAEDAEGGGRLVGHCHLIDLVEGDVCAAVEEAFDQLVLVHLREGEGKRFKYII